MIIHKLISQHLQHRDNEDFYELQASDAVHWMLPVGRSWQSITAGYVGLLSLGLWALGPVAIWLGIWAIKKARTGGHGRGRAVFAIVTGTLGTLFMALYVVMSSRS